MRGEERSGDKEMRWKEQVLCACHMSSVSPDLPLKVDRGLRLACLARRKLAEELGEARLVAHLTQSASYVVHDLSHLSLGVAQVAHLPHDRCVRMNGRKEGKERKREKNPSDGPRRDGERYVRKALSAKHE